MHDHGRQPSAVRFVPDGALAGVSRLFVGGVVADAQRNSPFSCDLMWLDCGASPPCKLLEHSLNRRNFIAGTAAAFSSLVGGPRAGVTEDQPFNANAVRQQAQELARKPYKAPDQSLPDQFKNVDYDAYRTIRFRPEQALWRSEKLPFQLQFFHRGWIFKDRVQTRGERRQSSTCRLLAGSVRFWTGQAAATRGRSGLRRFSHAREDQPARLFR